MKAWGHTGRTPCDDEDWSDEEKLEEAGKGSPTLQRACRPLAFRLLASRTKAEKIWYITPPVCDTLVWQPQETNTPHLDLGFFFLPSSILPPPWANVPTAPQKSQRESPVCGLVGEASLSPKGSHDRSSHPDTVPALSLLSHPHPAPGPHPCSSYKHP